MSHDPTLYHTILYYTTVHYTILHYTTMLCYTILYYTILHYTIQYYTILYYTLVLTAWMCLGVTAGDTSGSNVVGIRGDGDLLETNCSIVLCSLVYDSRV